MDHVTPSLVVGDADDAADHDALCAAGVDVVVSLTHDSPARPESGPAEGYVVVDRPLVDGPRNDYDDFGDAVDRTRRDLAAGRTVFVHCSAGASRSVGVAAAALAVLEGRTADDALERVCSARGVAAPHPALVERARRYVAEHGRE